MLKKEIFEKSGVCTIKIKDIQYLTKRLLKIHIIEIIEYIHNKNSNTTDIIDTINIVFEKCVLSECNIEFLPILNCTINIMFVHCNLNTCNIQTKNISGIHFNDCNINSSKLKIKHALHFLSVSSFLNSTLYDCTMSLNGSISTDAQIMNTKIIHCRFNKLSHISMFNSSIEECYFNYRTLENISLIDVSIHKSDLSHIKFINANTNNITITESNMYYLSIDDSTDIITIQFNNNSVIIYKNELYYNFSKKILSDEELENIKNFLSVIYRK